MSDEMKNVNVEATVDTVDTAEVVDTATPAAEPVKEIVKAEPVVETTPVITEPVVDELTKFLTENGVKDDCAEFIKNNLGVTSIEDLGYLKAEDLAEAGMKPVPARKLLDLLKKREPAPEPVEPPKAAPAPAMAPIFSPSEILPDLPTDDAWLDALKTGGVLKVEDATYIAAVRAALADKAGLYDVPGKLVTAMEKFAEDTDEQVSRSYFDLKTKLTRRSYADIFSAVPGLTGDYVTKERRKRILGRIRETLLPAIYKSFVALNGWYTSWQSQLANPTAFLAAMSGGLGMVNAPDFSIVHDAGDTLIDGINKTFRGDGVPVTAALAYDAMEIVKILDDTTLPSQIGAINKEQMLKKIDINVTSNYARLEKSLVLYVLSFVKHTNATTDRATQYFGALWQLGNSIDWAALGFSYAKNGAVNSIAGSSLL